MRMDFIPAITCLTLGALFLLGGFLFARGSLDFVRHATWVRGQVERIDVDRHDGGAIPVIAWRTRDGEEREYRGLGASAPQYRIGNDVGLYYFPATPTRARLDSLQELWLAAIIFAGVGLVFLIIGGLLLQVARKRSILGLGQVCFGVIAVLCLCGAVSTAFDSLSLLRNGERRDGKVTGFWNYRSTDTGGPVGRGPDRAQSTDLRLRQRTTGLASPIVHFTAGNGREMEAVGRSGDGLVAVGTAVAVLYPHGQPEAGRPATFIDLWIVPLVLAAVGAIFATLILPLQLMRRRAPAPAPRAGRRNRY